MIYRDLQKAFEIGVTSKYGAITNKPTSAETEHWLNLGKDKLIKTRWSGLNTKLLAYEQDQKRIEDLRNLKVETQLSVLTDKNLDDQGIHVYMFELPTDYLIGTGEASLLLPTSNEAKRCWSKDSEGNYIPLRTPLIQCTDHNIDEKLTNTLSDHRYSAGHRIRPLRLHNANEIAVYTDGNYCVEKYILTYLRTPNRIDIHTNPRDEYTDLPNHLHDEIVNMAVQLYLENRESPRYQSILNENSMME